MDYQQNMEAYLEAKAREQRSREWERPSRIKRKPKRNWFVYSFMFAFCATWAIGMGAVLI